MTPTYRQVQLVCTDTFDCGASYGAELSLSHQIHASRRPAIGVDLPLAPPRQRVVPDVAPAPANDDCGSPEVLSPANDTEPPEVTADVVG